MAAATGLMGVVLGGVPTAPQLRLYGLAGAASLVGFAQSLQPGACRPRRAARLSE